MILFWTGVVLGFFFNIIANQCWELRARFLAHASAKKLVGKWRAYNLNGRTWETMLGAGDTVIRAEHWWSSNSNVLQVEGVDTSDGRHHSGPLVIDPVCHRKATRTLIYDFPTPDEVVEQRIVISHDFKTLYVFPILATIGLPAYSPTHVLRRGDD